MSIDVHIFMKCMAYWGNTSQVWCSYSSDSCLKWKSTLAIIVCLNTQTNYKQNQKVSCFISPGSSVLVTLKSIPKCLFERDLSVNVRHSDLTFTILVVISFMNHCLATTWKSVQGNPPHFKLFTQQKWVSGGMNSDYHKLLTKHCIFPENARVSSNTGRSL